MHYSYGSRIKETFVFLVMIVVLLFALYFVSIYLFNTKTIKDDVVTIEPIKKQKTSPKTESPESEQPAVTTPQKKKVVHTHVRAHVKTKRRITRKKKISWGSQQFIKFHQHEESVFTPSN